MNYRRTKKNSSKLTKITSFPSLASCKISVGAHLTLFSCPSGEQAIFTKELYKLQYRKEGFVKNFPFSIRRKRTARAKIAQAGVQTLIQTDSRIRFVVDTDRIRENSLGQVRIHRAIQSKYLNPKYAKFLASAILERRYYSY